MMKQYDCKSPALAGCYGIKQRCLRDRQGVGRWPLLEEKSTLSGLSRTGLSLKRMGSPQDLRSQSNPAALVWC